MESLKIGNALFEFLDSEKKATKLLKMIERSTDNLSLFRFLLTDLKLPKATQENFMSYTKGVQNMAQVFGSTWSLQLVDFCLQEWIKEVNEGVNFQLLARLQDWAALVILFPVAESSQVESVIIDDLFQKFFYLIQKMKTIQKGIPQLHTIMEILSKLLDWLSGLTKLEITKTKLKIIFEEIMNSSSLEEQNLESLKIGDPSIGVFSSVQNWTPCTIGTLPFNYITE